MGQYNLNRIMKPQQVALVGASDKKESIGNALMRNFLDQKFPGEIFPVNHRYQNVHGCAAYKSVSELPPGIDLAIIATPIDTVPEIVRHCIQKQMGGAIVISAGGKEVGREGVNIEKQIRDLAQPAKFRIIGPNCLGIIQPSENLNATFVRGMPEIGELAFVSQSGAICSSILDLAFKEHIGFSHFISIGSMCDVDFGDMIDYLGNDSRVKSILLYIENLTNIRKFMSAARSVSRVKPIIVLKAGSSLAGAQAAASHTGAMVGEDAVYDAAFKRAGIVRVETIEHLFDCAELMAKQPPPRGARLAIITNGGGPGVMAADYLSSHGYEPTQLDALTLERLDEMLPSCWSRNNPIDILGDATCERFEKVLKVCMDSRIFDGLVVILSPQAITEPMAVAKTLVDAMKGYRFPVFACWMGGQSIGPALEFLNDSRIPTFDTPERAVQAFLYMVAFENNKKLLAEVPHKTARSLQFKRVEADAVLTRVDKNGFLFESDLMEILAAYGFPVIQSEIAETEEQASRISKKMGYPVVLKISSPDIIHKTDAAGICLDLRSDDEVRKAYRKIIDSVRKYSPDCRINGATIQPYFVNPDYEILLGAKRDREFGPVILFGMGGIFTEVLKDKALGLPPMNRMLAGRLMQETKAYTLLQGYRNRPAANLSELEELIVRLSQLLIDHPEINELDMNPILIKDSKAVVVDARMSLSPCSAASPAHLVISPYPQEYEHKVVTESSVPLFIRPIKPEDALLYVDFFRTLSPTSIYYRFFGALKALPNSMLSRFTQIDYDREIALVAIDQNSEMERILGVARIIGDPDGSEGEFAVLIADSWQGKGFGAALLKDCLLIAQQRGFVKIHGVVLRENKHMLALGKKMGFSVSRGESAGEYKLEIDFNSKGLPGNAAS